MISISGNESGDGACVMTVMLATDRIYSSTLAQKCWASVTEMFPTFGPLISCIAIILSFFSCLDDYFLEFGTTLPASYYSIASPMKYNEMTKTSTREKIIDNRTIKTRHGPLGFLISNKVIFTHHSRCSVS